MSDDWIEGAKVIRAVIWNLKYYARKPIFPWDDLLWEEMQYG